MKTLFIKNMQQLRVVWVVNVVAVTFAFVFFAIYSRPLVASDRRHDHCNRVNTTGLFFDLPVSFSGIGDYRQELNRILYKYHIENVAQYDLIAGDCKVRLYVETIPARNGMSSDNVGWRLGLELLKVIQIDRDAKSYTAKLIDRKSLPLCSPSRTDRSRCEIHLLHDDNLIRRKIRKLGRELFNR